MVKFGWEPFILTAKGNGTLPVNIPEENIIRIGESFYSEEKLVGEEGYRGISSVLKPFYFLYKKFGMEIWSVDRFLFTWGREVLKQVNKIKKVNPDAILATFDPAGSLWLGHILSKKIKKPWVADFRDPCSLSNNSKIPLVKFLDKKIDKLLIGDVSLITTVSKTMASVMEDFYKKPAKVVYNGFDADVIKCASGTTKNKKEEGKIIYYAGRFHSHRMPSVRLLIDWLAQYGKEDFRFIARSLGPAENNKGILDYAKEKNIAHKINLLGPAPLDVVCREESEADILTLFGDLGEFPSTLQLRGGIPGKFFEYLQFETPIIAIAHSNSEMGDILKDTSHGFLVSGYNELDVAMKNIFKSDFLKPNLEWVEKYSRESQCKILCDLLNWVVNFKIEK